MEQRAREFVMDYYNDRHENKIELHDVAIVWFVRTLSNWKAVLITLTPDHLLYEVTHNGAPGETYIDVYAKIDNIVV